MGIGGLLLFLLLAARRGAQAFTPSVQPIPTPPKPTPTPATTFQTATAPATPAKPPASPAAAPAATVIPKPAASAAAKPTVVPWPKVTYATSPSGVGPVPVPTFDVAPLPAFPAGWELDTPPPKAVTARAIALMPTLWKSGKPGAKTQEQTAGRWITYVAVAPAKGKKAVVAYRIKGQRAAA